MNKNILLFILILSISSCLGMRFHDISKKPSEPGNDPASSWLVYGAMNTGSSRITYVNSTWVVPSKPTNSLSLGNAPGWWFGIEPQVKDLLIQPILAWGDGLPRFTIFNGFFDWDNNGWYQSNSGHVEPGDTIFASVTYVPSNDSYTMYIASKNTGFSVSTNIGTGKGRLFNQLFFVVEHQPNSCRDYPSNGQITFDNINIEANNAPFTPKWSIAQYYPACNSTGQVVNPQTLKFTWNTN
eukprot:TRINITY_DN1125_c0_g1_i1.p1 TRINITY_DN1125_c0_g1~~TRINITY_DN1125_c0_g1_i1.p1  ORF type:complete len:240 (-),score=56.87 TRINITY_DN1125_c0_g1_i1:49-768(-)